MIQKIVGEWKGSKSIPLLASGECKICFREDGTAKAVGSVKIMGEKQNICVDDLCFEHAGGEKFVGKYQGHQIEFVLAGNIIKTTVNPYRLGAVENKRFDINIPIEMKRC